MRNYIRQIYIFRTYEEERARNKVLKILENFQIYFLWSIILKNISALICKGIKDNGNKLLLFRTFYGTEWV